MLEINSKGLVIERLDSILSRFSDNLREIYGADTNLDPDTQDGQMVGIYSQGLADLNEAIAEVYAMSDPTKAVGTWLDIQLKYVGSTRIRPKYSYLNNVEINTQIGTIFPSGYTIKDKNKNDWILVGSTVAASNKVNLQFRSSEYGAFNLSAEEPLTAKTVVLGVGTITNKANAELGNLKESDPSVLARFLRSYQQNNINDVEGLEGALLNLPDVRDVMIYENWTDSIDAKGVNGHSINVVIVGGNDLEIAEKIQLKKSMGCGLQGETTVLLFHRGIERPIIFDRAERIEISVKVTALRRNANTDVDVEAIKESIANNQFLINEDVIAGGLYCGINNGSYKIKTLTLSSGDVIDGLIIPIGLRQYGHISPESIEVSIE